eukprot:scaffold215089_cov21-Tisochrysis_lutea.AAC.1
MLTAPVLPVLAASPCHDMSLLPRPAPIYSFPALDGCGLVLKYELPGSNPTTFIDLVNDADVSNMWEAWREHCAMQAAANGQVFSLATLGAHKLRICVEQ